MAGFQLPSNQTPINKIAQSTTSVTSVLDAKSYTQTVSNAINEASGAKLSILGGINSLDDVDKLVGGSEIFFSGTSSTIDRTSTSLTNRNSTSGSSIEVRNLPEIKVGDTKQGQIGSPTLKFPPDLPDDYFICFSFMNYERPNPLKKPSTNYIQTLFLPIPDNLLDAHGITYNTVSQGWFGDIMNDINKSASMIGAYWNGDLSSVEGVWDTVKTIAGGTAGDLLRGADYVLESSFAFGESGGALSQQLGIIPNPNMSIMFNGPTMRSHNFKWRFSPNNADESETIKKIVTMLKQNILPSFSSYTKNILDYPSMVDVNIMPISKENFQVKRCVIPAININYSPHGVTSFFAGTQSPTLIDLELILQEIEYFTAEDFGSTGDRSHAWR